jgi:hypothetical protein
MSREGIKELERKLTDYLSNPPKDQKDQDSDIAGKLYPYNPNLIVPKYYNNWFPPIFSRRPDWHQVGDRVVNLKCFGWSVIPFGYYGTVVGILGNKPENGSLEIKIEVMFDKPFIGGNNLSGRCTWGRGAVVNFDEIFNMSRWNDCFRDRDMRKRYAPEAWDGYIKAYIPSFTVSESDTEKHVDLNKLQEVLDEKNVPKEMKLVVEKAAQSQPQNQNPTATTIPKTIKKKQELNNQAKDFDFNRFVEQNKSKVDGGAPQVGVSVETLEENKNQGSKQHKHDKSHGSEKQDKGKSDREGEKKKGNIKKESKEYNVVYQIKQKPVEVSELEKSNKAPISLARPPGIDQLDQLEAFQQTISSNTGFIGTSSIQDTAQGVDAKFEQLKNLSGSGDVISDLQKQLEISSKNVTDVAELEKKMSSNSNQ